MDEDVVDYAYSLELRKPKMESVESMKERRKVYNNANLEDLIDISSNNVVFRREEEDSLAESPFMFSKRITDSSKNHSTNRARDSKEYSKKSYFPVGGKRRNSAFFPNILPTSKLKQGPLPSLVERPVSNEKIEKIVKENAPLLGILHQYFEEHDKSKQKGTELVKAVLKIEKHAKPFWKAADKVNGFELQTWLRLSERKQKAESEEDLSALQKYSSKTKGEAQTNTDVTIARIMHSLNHKHPSESKRYWQDVDKKQRAGRKLFDIPKIVDILSKSKEKRTPSEIQGIDDYLRTVSVFESKPDYIIAQLCYELNAETFEEGGRLFRQGEIGNKFYFILQGTIRLAIVKAPHSVTDPNAPLSFLAIMKTGEKFGDQALMNDLPRSTYAFANEPNTVVLALEKEPFLRLMGVAHTVEIKNRIAVLKKYSLTANLDWQGLKMVADKLFTRSLPPNTVVVEENKEVESVFFIRSGRCAVFRDIRLVGKDGQTKTKRVLLGYLRPFSTFNEEIVLSRKAGRRSAPFTVITVDTVSLSSIVSYGEWINLNLVYSPSKFVTMSNDELVRQFKISQHKEKFRKYQKRLVEDLKKERSVSK